MDQSNTSQQLVSTEKGKVSVADIWKAMLKHKRIYYVVLSLTFAVTAFITISIPNYYKCTVLLAPELSTNNKGMGSLASLASNFGINLNNVNMGSDALLPNLYPDLMNSVAFRASLFPIKVQREDEDTVMTYYDYLKYGQKVAWWESAANNIKDWVDGMFPSDKGHTKRNVPLSLTKEQFSIIEEMQKRVVCDVDLMTLVISIEVTDPDPIIAATLADSIQEKLQLFIADYRTYKARVDLEHYQKLFKESKSRYETALNKYASFSDANRNTFLERIQKTKSELQSEVQIRQTAYSQISAQLQMAEARVQEETPAFMLLQPAVVPVKKKGPKRAMICLVFVFIAFIGSTIYILQKEGELTLLIDKIRPKTMNRNYDA